MQSLGFRTKPNPFPPINVKRYVAGQVGVIGADNNNGTRTHQWVFDKTFSVIMPQNGDICQATFNFPSCSNCIAY